MQTIQSGTPIDISTGNAIQSGTPIDINTGEPIQSNSSTDIKPENKKLSPVEEFNKTHPKPITGRGSNVDIGPLSDALTKTGKAVDWATKPLTNLPSQMANAAKPAISQMVPFGGPLTDFAGSAADNMTSPAGLATLGGSTLEGMGMRGVGGALTKMGSTPFFAQGAEQTLDPNSTLSDRAMGGLEMAGGALGMSGEVNPLDELKSNLKNTVKPIPPETGEFDLQSHISGPGLQGEVNSNTNPNMHGDRLPTTWQSIRNKLQNQVKPEDVTPEEVPAGIKQLSDTIGLSDSEKSAKWGSIQSNLKSLMMASSLNAPGAHGRGMITYPGYWNAFDDMFKSYGSDVAEKLVNESITDHPSGYFQSTTDPITGKEVSAIGNKLKLFGISTTDELPNIPSDNLVTRLVPGVKQGTRAYRAFVNKAKSDIFVQLYDQAVRDGRGNQPLADKIADQVNIMSGSGNMGDIKNSKTAMSGLHSLFFAPELDVARVQQYTRAFGSLLNYTGTDPVIRQAAWRSLIGSVGTGLLLNELSSKMDITPVNHLSALGAAGKLGYQLITGTKTNENGRTSNLSNPKFGGQNRDDIITSFLASRLNVIPDLMYEYGRSRPADRTPPNVTKAVAQKIAPFVLQDIYAAYKMNPLLPIPSLPLSMFGNPTPHEPGGR